VSRRNWREPKKCCVCGFEVRWNFGRCRSCIKGMNPDYRARLRKMTPRERQSEYDREAAHEFCCRPRWEYTNDSGEMELIRRVEEQETNKC
jgi:hypothetical protein